MTTITIPRSSAKKQELVAVPREEYEAYMAWLKRVKSARVFDPTASDKKNLNRARKNLAAGNALTIADLERELGTSR